MSFHLKIRSSHLQLILRKDIYTYLLRCMDLNINYSDQMGPEFQFSIWNENSDTNYLKQEKELVETFQGKEVHKMKIYLQWPSISIQLQHEDNQFLAELVLANA